MQVKLKSNKTIQIDGEDLVILTQFNWTLNDRCYVVRWFRLNGVRKCEYLHRRIMGFPIKDVDHKDGDKLNNMKTNLRLCTHQENNFNKNKNKGIYSSKYKGVSYYQRYKKWKVTLMLSGKQIWGGYFENEKEAALKYNELALLHHKKYANFNKGV